MRKSHYKFAVIIVIYHPSDDDKYYLELLCKEFNTIFIIDNTSDVNNALFANKINGNNYIANKQNLGLSAALNIGIHKAGKAGFENIFLFDQDTRVENNFFHEMLEFKYQQHNSPSSIYAPNFIDINSNTYAKFAKLNKWTWGTEMCNKGHQKIVSSFAITSGMLLSYKTFLKLGDFRNDYFIDHMDSEYCLRALTSNISIVINCHTLIKHKIGNRQKQRFFGIIIKPNNHPPLRRYYISRNGLDMTMRYFKHYPSIITLHIARIIHESLAILLYEKKKTKKLYAILLGTIHAFVRKSGQYDSPYF